MKILALLVIVLSIGAVGFVVYAQLQNRAQRTPTLTTDDVGSSRLSTSGEPDTVGGKIRWHKNLSSAVEAAKSGNKVIVVDVYTDWCGWCKRMDQDIFPDPKVVNLTRKAVFLKFDAEDQSEGTAFAKRMGVRGYPTTVILNSDGQKLVAKPGYPGSADNFVALVESARADQ